MACTRVLSTLTSTHRSTPCCAPLFMSPAFLQGYDFRVDFSKSLPKLTLLLSTAPSSSLPDSDGKDDKDHHCLFPAIRNYYTITLSPPLPSISTNIPSLHAHPFLAIRGKSLGSYGMAEFRIPPVSSVLVCSMPWG